MTYRSAAPAREAIREYDGANANGQPIRLTLMPAGPSASAGTAPGAAAPRNPFDTAVRPGRSQFDRIERRDEGAPPRSSRDRRERSRSPGRRTNTRKPPPEGTDRYVPGEGGRERERDRSRSPASRSRRRGEGNNSSRRGEGRRGGGRGSQRDDSGRAMVQGRPRFTAEELDKDM